MKVQATNGVTSSLPRDRSLEAYIAWIMDIAERLTTKKNAIEFSRREWIENWKDFWKQKPED